MKINTFLCDLCGDAISGGHVKFDLFRGFYEGEEQISEQEICLSCAGKLLTRIFRKNMTVESITGACLQPEIIEKIDAIARRMDGVK